jgi:hypothetical protein
MQVVRLWLPRPGITSKLDANVAVERSSYDIFSHGAAILEVHGGQGLRSKGTSKKIRKAHSEGFEDSEFE